MLVGFAESESKRLHRFTVEVLGIHVTLLKGTNVLVSVHSSESLQRASNSRIVTELH